ncbi:MAG: hypothetical protein NT120_04065 [Candidatus Aenigmarchaeota archaeon]|nr:hypothetical protein [Candidatus Aenigmarchaeota archaeon]
MEFSNKDFDRIKASFEEMSPEEKKQARSYLRTLIYITYLGIGLCAGQIVYHLATHPEELKGLENFSKLAY